MRSPAVVVLGIGPERAVEMPPTEDEGPVEALGPDRLDHPFRVIETIRAECLDWTLILGRRHLDRTLRTYVEHYNRGRPHRALGLASPLAEARDPIPVSPHDVRRRDL